MNVTRDDFQYAMETTRVIHEPDRRIATFGETRFEFQLVSEFMDRTGEVRVRSGEMEACKPLLIRPDPEMEMDGFGDEAREKLGKLLEGLRANGTDLAFLQYGFSFRRGSGWYVGSFVDEICHGYDREFSPNQYIRFEAKKIALEIAAYAILDFH